MAHTANIVRSQREALFRIAGRIYMAKPPPTFDSSIHGRTAMIVGGNAQRVAELKRLLSLMGCTALVMDDTQRTDFILVHFTSKMDIPEDFLARISRYLQRHRSTALVWTNMDGLEDAYAALPQGQCHFFVDADYIEAMPILAGAFGRGEMDRLHDTNRDVPFGSLHRISDELAEFARTLALMADSESKTSVSDKALSFRPAPLGGFQGFPSASAMRADATDTQTLREIIKLRRMRERFFPPDLFADPAWDILLDLKAAGQEGQHVSVSSLCIAAAVPPTTALRWITAMTDSGMLVRRQDPADARRVFIELSDETSAKLDDYFVAIGIRSAPII
jgi:DNA-binding MarR family transcriptional regulator